MGVSDRVIIRCGFVVDGIGLEYDCNRLFNAGDVARGDLGARAEFIGANDCFILCASN